MLGILTYHATVSSSSPPPANDVAATWLYEGTREETWSCLVVLLTFWSFASMTLILGFYGSTNLVLGPNSSQILDANSLFVQDIKLQSDTGAQGPELYGFSERPPLDVKVMWSEIHNVSVIDGLHKEWVYYLNEGSHISISYNINSQGSSPLILIIAKGEESLHRWMEDPLFPHNTLSWNLINGSGLVQQKILKSSDYYIAVGNLNPMPVEVALNFDIDALLYNTTGASYQCSLRHGLCAVRLSFLHTNAAVLATSSLQQNEDDNELFVKLSYEPRWITYLFGSALMTVVIVLAFKMINYLHCNSNNNQAAEASPERAPLLLSKDDDTASLGSSYDSVSNDENDIEESLLSQNRPDSLRWSEGYDPHHLCTICLDAAKDCFFLPCGHCATCFACGTRVVEDGGTCPICQRRMKKVKKIFTI
ncbi:unnamed protein product [Spirodela intermedia]|uniref:RING-type domain-containing protein n=1 Tax=Spirodela intermedia TaxID=51605 RepID=A0A7I8L8Q7_SPIIN|nr:unnamed protein product [Spirodela intermedia]